MRPPRDIDLLFVLPDTVRQRRLNRSLVESLTRNIQSEILQEVKRVLAAKYSTTKMRADGQVVIVPFGAYAVEVVPAFEEKGLLGNHNGKYQICDTNGGGKFNTIDPAAEKAKVKSSNDVTKGNTRDLIRMMKRWQSYCNVPMKSFWIELLAIEFLENWPWKGNGTSFYDWMVRDFLAFLVQKAGTFASVLVPGTLELIWVGDAWKSRAQAAHGRAVKATQAEADDMPSTAGGEWQKVFGSDIPTG